MLNYIRDQYPFIWKKRPVGPADDVENVIHIHDANIDDPAENNKNKKSSNDNSANKDGNVVEDFVVDFNI